MKHFLECLLILMLALPAIAFSADLDTLTENCSGCHGAQGVSTDSDIPTIAGQSVEFLTDNLESFRDRGRPCRKSSYRHGDTSRPETTMCNVASSLGDEDITALGNYYSELAFVAAVQEYDPELIITGRQLYTEHCESCHPNSGTVAERGPILAGQWTPYLKRSIQQVMSGEHLVPPFMERELVSFSGTEIDALLSFFASQQN